LQVDPCGLREHHQTRGAAQARNNKDSNPGQGFHLPFAKGNWVRWRKSGRGRV